MFGIFKSESVYVAHFGLSKAGFKNLIDQKVKADGISRVDALFAATKESEKYSHFLEVRAKTDSMARTLSRHAIFAKAAELGVELTFTALYRQGKRNGQFVNDEIRTS